MPPSYTTDVTDLTDLYQDLIIDHSKSPRNFRELPDANRQAEGYNPLCGDRVSLQARVDDEVISDIAFQGSGCAICTASASIMTETVKGKPARDAEAMFQAFHALLAGDAASTSATDFGKLDALAGVRNYPMRVKCATLPWHTLHAALECKAEEPVTTE